MLGVVATWPLVLHLGSQVPASPWDPFAEAWAVAWDGHALAHQPLSLFDANAMWPLHNSLAFADSLLGYAPFGLLGNGFRAAIIRYDGLFIFTGALAFAGGWALARELGVSRIAALVGGAAFAFAPWRIAQADHLNVLSSGGIALSLFLLLRGYRRRSVLFVLAGWIVAAWQVLIGFSLGLPFLYLLAALALISCLVRASRSRLGERRMLLASLAGLAIVGVTTALMALPYLQVQHSYPESVRSITAAKFYSPPLSSLLTAPAHERIWGALTASLRGHLAAITVLALGFRGPAGGIAYHLLYDLPGWSGIRTPGRLITFTTLALALLAAIGAQRMLHAVQGRSSSRRPILLTILLLVGAIVAEGSGSLPRADVLSPPLTMATLPGPILVLPSNDFIDAEYMPWTATSFQPMVNGISGFIPKKQIQFRTAASAFPAPSSIAWLEAHGIRTVILDRYLPPGDPSSLAVGYYPNSPVPNAQAILAARRAIPPGVTRKTSGRYTIYTLTDTADPTRD